MNRYTPRMNQPTTKAEGVLETICYVLDCTLNDRACYDNGYGFCRCDDRVVDRKGNCANYHGDFMYIAYISKHKLD